MEKTPLGAFISYPHHLKSIRILAIICSNVLHYKQLLQLSTSLYTYNFIFMIDST